MIKTPKYTLKIDIYSHILDKNFGIVIHYFDEFDYIGSFTRNKIINISLSRCNNFKTPENPPKNFMAYD